MLYDLHNDEERSKLNSIILTAIDDDEAAQTDEIRQEWDDADNYYENDQTPEGFEENFAEAFARVNDPKAQNKTSKMYVTINKVLTGHEGVIGDFTTSPRQIMVKGRSPKDINFAKVWKKELEFVQDTNRMWDTAIFPCIDTGIRRGLHWLKVTFDPYQDLPWGKIIVEEISARDVLVDKNSRSTFYQDRRRTAHRKRYLIEEANELFRDMIDSLFEGERRFSGDTDYAIGSQRPADDSHDQFCTVYEYLYAMKESRYFAVDESAPDDEMLQQVDEDTYMQLKTAKKKAIRIVDDVFYKAFYNRGLSTFFNAEHDIQAWTLIPFINIKSERRLYPLGSAKYDKNLQDLLNVVASLIVKHGSRSTDGIVGVSVDAFRQFQNEINEALKNPGKHAIPGITGVHFPHQLGESLPLLFQLVAGTMEDIQSQHGLSKGEMPKERLAKETVQLLLSQDRKSHGRKEVMVRWTLTELANVLVKVIQNKWTEEHWARTTDVRKGDDEYTPINMRLTEEEYAQLIMDIAHVPMLPNPTPQQKDQIDQIMMQAKLKFESENEVRRETQRLWQIQQGEQVVTLSEDQLDERWQQAGLTPEQGKEQDNPAPFDVVTYVVNDITQDPNVDVVMDIDFNHERDRQLKYNKATMALQMGAITPLRWLKDVEYEDADTAWAEAKKYNEALKVGEAIVSNPEAYKRAMQMLSSIGSGKQNSNGQKPKAKKPQEA